MAEKGVNVTVVTQRRKGQEEIEELDGFKVYGYPSHSPGLSSISARCESVKYYRKADADIYHSQAISYNSYIAQSSCPDRKHVVTFQDPYDRMEWSKIAQVEPRYTGLMHNIRVGAEIRFLARVCQRMDMLYSQAHFLVPKAMKLFKLKTQPKYLPNPVPIPDNPTEKAEVPTVCFLARWDPQKRVELFFELARKYPDINFIAMGKSHDPEKDNRLRKKYDVIPNLRLTGFVSEKEKQEILGRSWALVNTSIREALPVSFLEALANKTPLISGENPDCLVSEYGYHVKDMDYESGIEWLLNSDTWRLKGEKGRSHMYNVYEADKVIDRHLVEYRKLLE